MRFSWLYPLMLLLAIFILGIYTGWKNAGRVEETAAYVPNAVASSVEPESAAESTASVGDTESVQETAQLIKESGNYTSKEDVALYIHTYGKLPNNYITKKEAVAAGWDQERDSLDTVLPGMSIGGDEFGNAENKLPAAEGRKYYEADIDYRGGSRNAKRIVYANDGLIFYTEDGYQSFEQLY